MSNKVKCHICGTKNTTGICMVCGTDIVSAVEVKVLEADGTLIESKRKAKYFDAILTDHRLILTNLKSTMSIASFFGAVGVLAAAVGHKGDVISINLVDIKSITNYTKMTLARGAGLVIELNDGSVLKLTFLFGNSKYEEDLVNAMMNGIEGAEKGAAMLNALRQHNYPYTEINESLPL